MISDCGRNNTFEGSEIKFSCSSPMSPTPSHAEVLIRITRNTKSQQTPDAEPMLA